MSVAFPLQGDWIPNVDQLVDTGAGLLEAVGATLDSFGFGEPYVRRVFTFEDPPAQRPNTQQLGVSFNRIHLGLAGQEQFTFASGSMGAIQRMTAVYTFELVGRWPAPRGGQSGALSADDDVLEATRVLWRDALVAYSALRAVALGGIRTDPPVAPIVQDNVLVGPMAPKQPSGTLATIGCQVHVQL